MVETRAGPRAWGGVSLSLPWEAWPLVQDFEGKLAVVPDSRVPRSTATHSCVVLCKGRGAQLLICG